VGNVYNVLEFLKIHTNTLFHIIIEESLSLINITFSSLNSVPQLYYMK
jgi:hypothetical protein